MRSLLWQRVRVLQDAEGHCQKSKRGASRSSVQKGRNWSLDTQSHLENVWQGHERKNYLITLFLSMSAYKITNNNNKRLLFMINIGLFER